MKHLHWLTPSEQSTLFKTIWRTTFFREKAQSDPWLSGILKRVSQRDHAIAEQSSPLERLHFSTFWNVWIFHEHSNPYIFDLGVLHELIHSMLFQSKRVWSTSPALWTKDALGTMERAVSLRTEVCVYRRWPQLRQHTFEMPIWADAMMKRTWAEIKTRRGFLMDAGREGVLFEDAEEQRIARYAKMNQRWNSAWALYGPLIETAWRDSYQKPATTTTLFSSLFENDCVDGIPFFQLAQRFGATKTLSSTTATLSLQSNM